MWILYLDESGHSETSHLVVGGVALYERSTYWLKKELDELVQSRSFISQPEDFVLHATRLRVPNGASVEEPFASLTAAQRRDVLAAAIDSLRASTHGVFFATVVEKSKFEGDDPYEVAFEDLVSRFDLFISRENRKREKEHHQRGLVVIAESHYRSRIEIFADRILRDGTQWRSTRNLSEAPLFTPANKSRLLQVADIICNAVFGYYEKGLASDFNKLMPKFDQDDGRVHGLTHLASRIESCYCPACMSYRWSRQAQQTTDGVHSGIAQPSTSEGRSAISSD